MANERFMFSDRTMAHIGLFIKWIAVFTITGTIFPMLIMASISTTVAVVYICVRVVYLFFEGFVLLIYNLTLGRRRNPNVGCPEYQEVMAEYERQWYTDTPPSTPPSSYVDLTNIPDEGRPTLPSTIAYLQNANILPGRRWSASAAPEARPHTTRDPNVRVDQTTRARRRIDMDALGHAMRSTTDEQERTRRVRFSDEPTMTLPERRRRRLDLQRERIDRDSLLYQWNQWN
ncbi:hypothetical protein B0I37DRAFT_412685 [Chaetomium sp. MPI-CAGE-AT-0009]|nr:hypothetical protein B0I37DRAFT_412685 [Chaetomium sp. MPI-CAGE-AT-0009]